MILTLLLLTVSLSQGREQQWNYIKRKNTHWRSAGQNRGPSEWTGMCNNGEKQSPIDIRKASRRKIYSRSHKEMDTLFPPFFSFKSQNGYLKIVLKSACHEDSKTPPTCLI